MSETKPETKRPTATYVPRVDGDPAVTIHRGIRFRANVATPVSEEQAEQLKTNPWFSVNGKKPAEMSTGGRPTNDIEYRRWFSTWISKARSSDEVVARWASEEALRTECGIGTDDLDFMAPIYNATLDKLRQQETEILEAKE